MLSKSVEVGRLQVRVISVLVPVVMLVSAAVIGRNALTTYRAAAAQATAPSLAATEATGGVDVAGEPWLNPVLYTPDRGEMPRRLDGFRMLTFAGGSCQMCVAAWVSWRDSLPGNLWAEVELWDIDADGYGAGHRSADVLKAGHGEYRLRLNDADANGFFARTGVADVPAALLIRPDGGVACLIKGVPTHDQLTRCYTRATASPPRGALLIRNRGSYQPIASAAATVVER